MSIVSVNDILTNKGDVFPNKGSFAGSPSRDSTVGETISNADDNVSHTVRVPLKTVPLSGIKGLLTSDVLSQVFIIMSEEQKSPSNLTKENVITSDDARTTEEVVVSSQTNSTSNVEVVTKGDESIPVEYPITKEIFSNSVTNAYTEMTDMELSKLNSNVFFAA